MTVVIAGVLLTHTVDEIVIYIVEEQGDMKMRATSFWAILKDSTIGDIQLMTEDALVVFTKFLEPGLKMLDISSWEDTKTLGR